MSSVSPDEVNRLWQHGLHEERLFHDRLNYFSLLEMGLLTICGVMYNKESSLGFFLPLTGVALLFTLLWLVIQTRHYAYCVHINKRIREVVPEYKQTTAGFTAGGHHDGLSISRPLALAIPMLFAFTWVAFFVWILVRPGIVVPPDAIISVERILLVVLIAALVWIALKLRRLERTLQAHAQATTGRMNSIE
jgi:hypothetical protein